MLYTSMYSTWTRFFHDSTSEKTWPKWRFEIFKTNYFSWMIPKQFEFLYWANIEADFNNLRGQTGKNHVLGSEREGTRREKMTRNVAEPTSWCSFQRNRDKGRSVHVASIFHYTPPLPFPPNEYLTFFVFKRKTRIADKIKTFVSKTNASTSRVFQQL